jgi:lysophospholipase L1-like esterase
MTSSSRNRRRRLDVVVPIVVTALLLAGVEFGASLLVTTAAPSTEPLRLVEGNDAVSQTLGWLDINLAPLDKDVDFLWRNRPSVEKRQPVNPQRWGGHDEWTIRNSSRRVRGPELADDPKPPGALRILCVGDSVTFGFNVDQDDSYPERLQAMLRERFPRRAIDVVNAGTPGWSFVQGLLFLEHEGLALQPNVVIMAFGANDRYFPAKVTDSERIGRLRALGTRWTELARLTLERTNAYRLVEQWFAPAVAADDTLSPACHQQVLETKRCRRVALGEIEAAVSAAARLTRDAGASLLLLNLDFMETDAVVAVKRAAQRERVPLLDLVAAYRLRRAVDEADRARRLGLMATRMPGRALGVRMPPTRVLFRVFVPPGATSVAVRGRAFTSGEEFAGALSDDGAGGDEIASDGVWSAWLSVPSDALMYQFLRDGALELVAQEPLPSSQATRQRDAVGEMIYPVEVFGDLFLMVERMHPDAAGHRSIAESVLEALPSLPAYAEWAGGKTT